MAYDLTVRTSALQFGPEFDYEVVGGDTLYYGNTPDVSSTNNVGSLSTGEFLSRAVTSWVVSADDTLTLVCDGTDWYEVSRSAN